MGRKRKKSVKKVSVLVKLRRLVIGILVSAVVLLAIVIGTARVFFLQAPKYQAQIEQQVSAVIGAPTKIDEVDVRWRWRGPEIWLRRLTVTPATDVRTTIDRVQVNIALWHWLRTRQWTAKHVYLQRPKLQLIVNADHEVLWGERSLTSLANVDQKESGHSALALLPNKFGLTINSAEFTIVDRRHGEKKEQQWQLTDFHSRARLRKNHWRFELGTDLPAGLGQYFEFELEVDDLNRAAKSPTWQAMGRGLGLELDAWQKLLPELPATLEEELAAIPQLSGSSELVLTVAGEAQAVEQWVAQIFARDFVFEFSEKTESTWQADTLSTLLTWRRAPRGWQFDADDIEITRAGESWPQPGSIKIEATRSDGETESEVDVSRSIKASADFVRVSDLSQMIQNVSNMVGITKLPVGKWRGDIRNLKSVWHVSDKQLERFKINADIERFAIAWPAADLTVSGLTGRLSADEQNAEFVLVDTTDVELTAPAVFSRPLQLGTMTGRIAWQRDANGWSIETQDAHVESAVTSARVVTRFTKKHDIEQPYLNFHATVERLDANAFMHQYLPTGRMPKQLAPYLQQAFVKGVARGELGIAGPIDQLPYGEDATFSGQFAYNDAEFRPGPGWPLATAVNAKVAFDGPSIHADNIIAFSHDLSMENGTVDIADVRKAVVHVHIPEINGRLSDYKKYLINSPLKNRTGGRLRPIAASGEGAMDLKMRIPVSNLKGTTSKAITVVKNGGLKRAEWPTELTKVNGQLLFDNGRWSSKGLSGAIFGRRVSMAVQAVDEADHLSDFELAPSAHTVMHLAGKLKASDFANVDPMLAEFTDGESQWDVNVVMPKLDDNQGYFQFGMQSDLDGIAVDLPEPLAKSASGIEPWSMQLDFSEENRIRGHMKWVPRLNAEFDWRLENQTWVLDRSTLALGIDRAAHLRPFPGLVVTGRVDQVAFDRWWPVFSGSQMTSEAAPESNFSLGELQSVDLWCDQAEVLGWPLDDLRIQVNRSGQEWLVQFDSEKLAGVVFFPFELEPGQPITANLDRFYWQASGEQISNEFDPKSLPAMRLEVKDFRFKDINAGTLFAQLKPLPDGIKIVPFSTVSDALEMHGEVVWRQDEAGDHSELHLQMKSSDVKQAMKDLAFDPALEADLADVRLNLRWEDSLRMKDLDELDGDISLTVLSGQLYGFDPGAGKILGLLSIASLPKRLSLDFRDVFDKGLGFDRIEGDFEIHSGLAETENLTLEGPAGLLAVVGSADLVDRIYDQTAVVQASVGSALPVAGVVAGGPVVGAALLVFSELFKKPLQEMSALTYRITGSFDDPVIERVVVTEEEALF
ncbi:MAG: TIGR02099 family protein [Gammaproteobacteria bacterium]|nr:TIGR02099 family protein [Gammaproteobacteria bacterium]